MIKLGFDILGWLILVSKDFKELSKQGILGAGKITKLDECESCIFGKSVKVKFSSHPFL